MSALAPDLIRIGLSAVAAQRGGGFEAYRNDPGGFHRDVLGTKPWEAQIEIAQAINESDFVTVRSGHGIGKSFIAGGTGLWFLATRPAESIVILSAPTYKQVQEVLWKETRLRYLKSKRSLGGRIAKKAATGLRWVDGRAMFGVTATEAESFAGIRAPEMLVIVDESSGVKDDIFTAITGNIAGGGKVLLLGNPTRTSGYFHRSHTTDAQFEAPTGKRIHVPSTRSPNVVAGHIVIPGLVTAEWVEARKIEWGEDSPLYKCRVLGDFVELEEGRVFTNDMIFAAEQRWEENAAAALKGRLVIGLDPAGESGDGDESAFAPRRGKRVLEVIGRRGLTPDAHVVDILGLIDKHHRGSARPLVVVDRDGIIGAKVYAALVAYQSQHEDAFEVQGVRGGERAKRRPKDIDRVRDEVWLHLADAVRDGLEFPEDVKLARDLASVRLEQHLSGRSKILDKDAMRKELGRSPDRGDAVALSAWGRDEDMSERTSPARERGAQAPDPYEAEPERVIDPYAALEKWG